MANQLTSSLMVSGDIEAIFAALKEALVEIGFTEISSSPPKKLQLQRGKGGLLKTKIQDCKTDLRISLKESPTSDVVDILFDYTFEIPGIFTDGDRKTIEGELIKIKHKLFDVSPAGTPKFFRAFGKQE